jgi:hypothetical protein
MYLNIILYQWDLDLLALENIVYPASVALVILVAIVLWKTTNLKKYLWRGPKKSADSKGSQDGQPPQISVSVFKGLLQDVEKLKHEVSSLTACVKVAEGAIWALQQRGGSNPPKLPPRPVEKTHSRQQPKRRTQPTYPEYSDSRNEVPWPTYDAPARDAISDQCAGMINLYNVSRNDQSNRTTFREKYQPFFINVANDVSRRRNEDVAPEFRKDSDGSYLAVPYDQERAIVFPDFTVSVAEAVYGPGALGEVFSCPDFDRRYSYPDIRVDTPAIFKPTGGDNWRLDTPGRLILGQPEEA